MKIVESLQPLAQLAYMKFQYGELLAREKEVEAAAREHARLVRALAGAQAAHETALVCLAQSKARFTRQLGEALGLETEGRFFCLSDADGELYLDRISAPPRDPKDPA